MTPTTTNRKTRTALLSVVSNSCLIAMKVVVGLFTGSVSIISEAIHSSMDLLAAGIALIAVRNSDREPDAEHPYGHGKIENVSGVIEAALILAASVIIVVESISKLVHPHPIDGLGFGFAVMTLSAIVNWLVSRRLAKVAKEEDSVALAADALHLRADVVTSLGVGIGLLVIWLASFGGLNLSILDPIVAIGVAIFISRQAVVLLVEAFEPLIDTSLPADDLRIIEDAIRAFRPEGQSYHQLRTRKAGKLRHIDFHLTMPGAMTVNDAHDVCDRIEQEIESGLPNTSVIIHVEPEGHT